MSLEVSPAEIQALMTAVDQAQSASALVEAVTALANAQSVSGIPTLMAVLGFNNPGAAVVAMNGLIRLGQDAVRPLLQGLDGYNYGARAYAIRALAAIGHPNALDVLVQAALSDFAPSVRRAATKGLGCLAWEMLATADPTPAQTEVVTALETLIAESDWALRYAVVVAAADLLPQLTQPELQNRIVSLLQGLGQRDPDIAVRARVQLFAMSAPTYRHLISPVFRTAS